MADSSSGDDVRVLVGDDDPLACGLLMFDPSLAAALLPSARQMPGSLVEELTPRELVGHLTSVSPFTQYV